MTQPKKWTELYPYGTKEGDEEAKVFRALARDPKFQYRSIPAIVKTTGLSRDRVEEIIEKYATKVQPPLIYSHPTNEENWGYWERCPEVLKKDNRGISAKDKDNRIDKQISGHSMVSNQCDSSDPVANSTTQVIASKVAPLICHPFVNKIYVSL